MPAVLALISSVLWGVADFVGGFASRRATALQVLAISMPVGWLLLVPIAAIVGGDVAASAPAGVLAGMFGAIGILALYAALTIGPMGVLSPVSAVLGAAVPVIAGLVLGERPGAAAYVGMALAAAAIVTVGLEPRAPTDDAVHQRVTPRALGIALIAGFCIGMFFVAISLAPESGGLWPVAWARGTSSAITLLIALVVWLRRRGSMFARGRSVVLLCVLAGALDVSANAIYLLALNTPGALLSVVSVLGSLYPAATVLLARFVLAERLRPLQKVGMGLALAASALLALGG
ncbi:MAG: DMT family transporter [Actinobacteria bacterium]|nr:DMT family transporter [Actinomycetota bacterium]